MKVPLVSFACAVLLFLHESPHASDDAAAMVEVWVVLSEPALATLPRDATKQRTELRQRILRQQDDIMSQLAALGASESGRVQHVSNAIAVTLPRAAIQSARQIKGVIEIRPITHRHRIGE